MDNQREVYNVNLDLNNFIMITINDIAEIK